MPPTFPNQRMIKIHRESVKTDFLGIKNENWQAASRDLGAHALQLYLYLASNANNYTVALSPAAVRQSIGMARSTYHDQFHRLVDKGYLVHSHGNTFEFYEVPQAVTRPRNELSDIGYDFEENTCHEFNGSSGGQFISAENIEINNTNKLTDNTGINILENNEAVIIQKPKVKEIPIEKPTAEGIKSPKLREETFVF